MDIVRGAAEAAHAISEADLVALSSFHQSTGRKGIRGWFRTVIDRESLVTVMANTPGDGRRSFVTVSVRDREYLAISDGASPLKWLVRDREPNEYPDDGTDSILWLTGATRLMKVLHDGSVVMELSRDAAIAEGPNSERAHVALDGMPETARARVWMDNGNLDKALFEFPERRRPKMVESRRLVIVTTNLRTPRRRLHLHVPGSEGVEQIVQSLIRTWPSGETFGDATPPKDEWMKIATTAR